MRISTRFLPFALTAALLSTLALPNVADAIPDRLKMNIERSKDEVKESKKLVKDDKKDFKAINKIVEKWHDAWKDNNESKMAKFDEKLLEWLREELAENRQDRARAQAELESTGADMNPQQPAVQGSTPAKRRALANSGSGGGIASDNDRQADARSDLDAAAEDARATRDIAQALRSVQSRYDAGTAGPQVHEEKSQLLRELVRGARRDYRRSTRELAEDEQRLDMFKDRR